LESLVPIDNREHQNIVRKASRWNRLARILRFFSTTVAAPTK
jgi:hypothetical protein